MEESNTEKRKKGDKTHTLCTVTAGAWGGEVELLGIRIGWIKKSFTSCDKNQKIMFNVKL